MLVGVVMFMITPNRGKQQFLELGLIFCLTLAAEAIVTIGYYAFQTSMNLVYNIFNLLTLPVAVLLYRRRISWPNKNRIAAVVIVPFQLFGLVNLFFIQGITKYNSYTLVLASFLFIVISITYFFILIRELPTESISRLPMFWINSAVLIFYSGTFVIYLSADYLAHVLKNNMVATWLVHNFLGVIYYSILCYALWLIRAEYVKETR